MTNKTKVKKSKQSKKATIVSCILMLGVILTIMLPLGITLITSLRKGSKSVRHFFALPESVYFDNYATIFSDHIGQYFANSFYVTFIAVILIVIFIPIASYAIARNKDNNKFFKFLYLYMLVGIFVPFQVFMLPLTSTLTKMDLLSKNGLVLVYVALAASQSLFLYIGYVATNLPIELEEAAKIDGAGKTRMYFSIIFPLLQPMTSIIVIKNALWIWNDFLLPQLIIGSDSADWTVPLFQFNYQNVNAMDYGPNFALYVVSMVPIIIVYIFFQRQIISGMTSGAVK